MTDRGVEDLARRFADIERRLTATERATRLQKSSVGIATSDDDDAPVIDLVVGQGLWTAVEAGADATTALGKVALAARTFNQPTAPQPLEQFDGIIPAGSKWNDTSNGNAEYRWAPDQTWRPVPYDTGTLTPQLLALIRMRFADAFERDLLIPFPEVGMECYLTSTGLQYQYSTFGWTPIQQYVKKPQNTTRRNTSSMSAIDSLDPDLGVLLVGGTYRVVAYLHYTTAAAAGLQTAWTFSGSVVTGNKSCLGPAVGSTTAAAVSQMRASGHNYLTTISYGGATTATLVVEDILMRVDSTGVLGLVWAQQSSTNGDTTMSAASRLYVQKLADTV